MFALNNFLGNIFRAAGQSIDYVVPTYHPISELNGKAPQLDASVKITPTSKIIGDVQIAKYSSLSYGSYVDGSENSVYCESSVSIGPNAVIEASKAPTLIGTNTYIGPNVHIDSSTIGPNCEIGPNSVILPGSVIQEGSKVIPGSVITPQ